MRLLRFFGAIFAIAFKRMVAQPGLVFTTALGLVIAVALGLWVPGFLRATLQAAAAATGGAP